MHDAIATLNVSDLWTHRQTAWFLKITPGTLYVWVSKGTGPRSYKINGSRRYDPRDVQEFIQRRADLVLDERASGTDLSNRFTNRRKES